MSMLLSSLYTGHLEDRELEHIVEAAVARLEAGESLDIEEFAAAHSPHAEKLREILPTIQALHQVGNFAAPIDWNSADSSEIATTFPRQALGDFRLIRELGRGGMGAVFEAEQLSMGRRVALKILPFAALVDPKALQRFQNEVRAVAALDHPNIVSVYSVGEDRGVHYFAMQLIRGKTLAAWITELRGTPAGSDCDAAGSSHETQTKAQLSTLPTHQYESARFKLAARLGVQAASAIQHAHDQGILHRDLKPGNLMLDTAGQLYVTDFGLARIDSEAGMTMTGDLLGTLRYMAPEQALAKRVIIDHRADVYSLGATLYELLTLEPVFAETDRAKLLHEIASAVPRPLRSINRHISAELETIVLKALAKQPEERYQSALEFREDLTAYLANRPIRARPPSTLNQVTKWAHRHSMTAATLVIATSIVAAVATVAGILLAFAFENERQQRGIAVAAAKDATRERRRAEKVLALEQSLKEMSERHLYRARMREADQSWHLGHASRSLDILFAFANPAEGKDQRGWEWYYQLARASWSATYRASRPFCN